MKYTLGTTERLKSRKLITRLYTEGKTIRVYPFKMVYLKTPITSNYPAQFGVSVPKRNFKKAVERNKLKRIIREAYRLNKYIVYSNIDKSYVFMITYITKETWEFQKINDKLVQLLEEFINQIRENNSTNE